MPSHKQVDSHHVSLQAEGDVLWPGVIGGQVRSDTQRVIVAL